MSNDSHKLDEAEQILRDLEDVERKLETLERGLMRSHRLATLGTMASIIAHEFNNILTPVISYCQLARQAPEDAALMRKAIDKALSGAERAAEISASMLGFSREDDTKSCCGIAEVVDETLSCLGRPPEKDGIKLRLDLDRRICAAMSPLSLQQVLLNLVLNARQAMRRRGGELTIACRPNAHKVLIKVADTGPGIPTDLLPRVFEPFVTRREEQEDDHEEKGTGLGLAVCRDLVERAGGHISIPRTDSQGTTFVIELPRAEAAESGEEDGEKGRNYSAA